MNNMMASLNPAPARSVVEKHPKMRAPRPLSEGVMDYLESYMRLRNKQADEVKQADDLYRHKWANKVKVDADFLLEIGFSLLNAAKEVKPASVEFEKPEEEKVEAKPEEPKAEIKPKAKPGRPAKVKAVDVPNEQVLVNKIQELSDQVAQLQRLVIPEHAFKKLTG